MIKKYGYETYPQTRTFDLYNDVDCFNYSDVHDYIKYLKHGYSKVTDHASREIRLRRMTREQGVELVKKYTKILPNHLHLFLNWIGITENSFYFIVNQHRNKKVWIRSGDWDWDLKDLDFDSNDQKMINNARLKLQENECNFTLTPLKRPILKEDKYILIGKGFVNDQY